MNLSLFHALRMAPSSCIAFIGAGGKTTAMFNLARALQSRVILTATTHMGAWQTGKADKHIPTTADSLEQIEVEFKGILLVTGKLEGDRFEPVNDNLLGWLIKFCKNRSIPLLIEADGSRQKPLKGWADHEPPIPSIVDLVVQVAGLAGLGKPLSDRHVHRPAFFSKLGGLDIGESIPPEAITMALTHSGGGLKNVPGIARKVVLLNQADTTELQSKARAMTPALLTGYHSVIIASLENEKIYAVHEPIAGIILAAGGSTRFGTPKQLLDWRGRPFIRAVAETAIHAGLSPVIVVTGSNAEQIEAEIRELNVTVTRNNNWQSGQGSSIKEGISTLAHHPSNLRNATGFGSGIDGGSTERVGGVVFLLADQPQIHPAIIQALIEKHAEGLYPIVAPMVIDRRANPVLFDRVAFPDLMTIEGDMGGRAIFHKHRVEYLPWHDDDLLLDVDTPEQYQRLISNEDI